MWALLNGLLYSESTALKSPKPSRFRGHRWRWLILSAHCKVIPPRRLARHAYQRAIEIHDDAAVGQDFGPVINSETVNLWPDVARMLEAPG